MSNTHIWRQYTPPTTVLDQRILRLELAAPLLTSPLAADRNLYMLERLRAKRALRKLRKGGK